MTSMNTALNEDMNLGKNGEYAPKTILLVIPLTDYQQLQQYNAYLC
jgi:hypothetical protein